MSMVEVMISTLWLWSTQLGQTCSNQCVQAVTQQSLSSHSSQWCSFMIHLKSLPVAWKSVKVPGKGSKLSSLSCHQYTLPALSAHHRWMASLNRHLGANKIVVSFFASCVHIAWATQSYLGANGSRVYLTSLTFSKFMFSFAARYFFVGSKNCKFGLCRNLKKMKLEKSKSALFTVASRHHSIPCVLPVLLMSFAVVVFSVVAGPGFC